MAARQLSAASCRLLLLAGREAAMLGHSYVGTEHLLLAFLAEPEEYPAGLLREAGLDYGAVRLILETEIGIGGRGLPVTQGLTPRLQRVLRGAAAEELPLKHRRVEPEHLLLALLREPEGGAAGIARMLGEQDDLFTRVLDRVLNRERGERKKEAALRMVEQFCEDMIAAADQTCPVIGRDQETETVLEILCRKQKNNPALVGEPGVGKTAIVEGLAQRMAAGQVPECLRGKRLMNLSLAGLLAGTKYRGEFEERVRDLVQELRRSGNVILFVDEMHTLIGAGSAEGAIDAANLLKPALSRGEIQMIGATTLEEYRKYIEKDAALERRFRKVLVTEPSEQETERILQGLRPGLEQHHHIPISDEAIHAAVELSRRYQPEYFLPDKAVDLLDESAAHAVLGHAQGGDDGIEQKRQELSRLLGEAVRCSRFEEAVELRDRMVELLRRQAALSHRRPVSAQDVAQTISRRTGIPLGRITESERRKMQELEQQLCSRVVGQDEACRAVARAIRRSRTGLRDDRRPVAAMLFMGPTGVGKTELCRVLAEQIYGTPEALIRLDMSEYMERHTVSRLLGAPPGYVGHGESGELTEKIRRRPYSVVLLDEIEKAHRDICGILLQIMEEGCLTDSMGRKADFRNAVVIMTSNLGAESGGGLGFENTAATGRESASLKERFSPEFLGRLDCVVPFAPLERSSLEKIAVLQLGELQTRVGKQGLRLEIAEGVDRALAAECGKRDGARMLRRLIRERIEDPLADHLLAEPELQKISVEPDQNGVLCLCHP